MAATAAPFAAATEGNGWTVDDILSVETASGWTISPNGALAAWVRSTAESVDGSERRVSNLSVGAAPARPGDDAGAVARRADAAMYESKRSGRNHLTLAP